jgi:RHS repeat-associated protein
MQTASSTTALHFCAVVCFSASRYTGKERDPESNNDYFGARYFASSMGRFMSPDPAGVGYASPYNPQSLNLYSYALNNPLINIDPSGMECVWDDGSYDSADDPDTGNAAGCSGQGGTYVNPNLFENALLTNGKNANIHPAPGVVKRIRRSHRVGLIPRRRRMPGRGISLHSRPMAHYGLPGHFQHN